MKMILFLLRIKFSYISFDLVITILQRWVSKSMQERFPAQLLIFLYLYTKRVVPRKLYRRSINRIWKGKHY